MNLKKWLDIPTNESLAFPQSEVVSSTTEKWLRITEYEASKEK